MEKFLLSQKPEVAVYYNLLKQFKERSLSSFVNINNQFCFYFIENGN